MRGAELAEIVDSLRAIGADIADVEVKKAQGGLLKSLRATPLGAQAASGAVRAAVTSSDSVGMPPVFTPARSPPTAGAAVEWGASGCGTCADVLAELVLEAPRNMY
ncbi:hypothetical protein [Protofrankia coriariae]|uniref:hypothetical protein n=1 Tax=Protofrankia coriariae TaxID=1562887 RepID=UPI000A321A46|nr:hypothetical protein [Protofrankia coriariae]